MNDKQSERWSVTLCGRNGSCCPVVTQSADGGYEITDDYGGRVVLTAEQMRLLHTAVDHASKEE